MKDFTEALCAHFDDHSPFESWDTAHIIQAIRRFDAQWRPAPPAPGVDTSPAALRRLAGHPLVHRAAGVLLRAVADEKEAALERLTRIDEEIEQAPQAPAAENRAELLQEDIDSLNMCLDDAGAPREEGGRPLSLWGRVCRMAPQAPSSAWRPMSEAPKGGHTADGTLVTDPDWVEPPRILLAFEDNKVAVGFWDWYYAPPRGHGYRNDEGWPWRESASHADLISNFGQPIGWMPLPAGPAQEGG